MTKTSPIRVLSRRPFRETDPNDPAVAVVFDDDGNMLAETVSEICQDDAAAILALVEQRRADAEMLVEALSPSAFALHLTIQEALEEHTDALDDRFAGAPPHLLILVRVPSKDWYRATATAFASIVSDLVADRVKIAPKTNSVIPDYDRSLNRSVLPVGTVLHQAKMGHVVALYSDPDQLPTELVPFCDAELDLTRISRRHFDLAIGREFDQPVEVAWSPKIRLSDFEPDLLDAICSRARDAAQVVRMLGAVLAGRAIMQKEAAKKEKSEAAAKISTASAKAVYTPVVTRPTTPTLHDLHGYGVAQAWGRQLAEDISDYTAGNLPWSDVDGGCLLHGPPGTGKTLFASALAASCGLPFLSTSYAQWQSNGDGHLGWVIKAMRATFEAANDAAPCVLFIDEVDSLRRRGGSGDSDGWWTAIVNAVLECLDGTSRREGIVVVAACNNPGLLDPAMIRSGRLDRQFEIALPDEASLLGIMHHHLPDAVAEELAPAATALAGSASGADIARIAREARRIARREKRAVTAMDLLTVAIPLDTRPDRDRRLVAIHEAGHAIAMMSQGRVPDMLSIVSADGAHGGVRSESPAGMGRLADLEDEIVVRLSGRAAEEVLLGEPSAGAMGDLRQATELASRLIGLWGLGGRLFYSDHVDGSIVESRLRDLYSRSLRLMGEQRSLVEKLAELAVQHRVLGRAALQAFAIEHELEGA